MRFIYTGADVVLVVLCVAMTVCGGGVASDTSEGGPTGEPSATGSAPEAPPTSGAPTSGEDEGPEGGDGSTGGGEGGWTGGGGSTTLPLDSMAWCGNGIFEPENDEECDYGGANADVGECTTLCTLAKCGDGFVQAWKGEVCDDGAANVHESDPLNIPYGGCSDCITAGHSCGDGTVEGPEECDPEARVDSAKCESNSCLFFPRQIFVTSTAVRGDLIELGVGVGIDGADKHCNELAAGNLDGTFRAWLLASGNSVESRFGLYALDTETRFVRADGVEVAKGFADLMDGLSVGVTISEEKKDLEYVRVWTNITTTGASTSFDCGQWTKVKVDDGDDDEVNDVFLLGFVGLAAEDGATWTQKDPVIMNSTRRCDLKAHLYCVQVSE